MAWRRGYPARLGRAWLVVLTIPKSEEDVALAQDVADILVSPEGQETTGGERFFEDSARALLTGVILHALYTEAQPSLRSCLQLLSSPAQPVLMPLPILRDLMRCFLSGSSLARKQWPTLAQDEQLTSRTGHLSLVRAVDRRDRRPA